MINKRVIEDADPYDNLNYLDQRRGGYYPPEYKLQSKIILFYAGKVHKLLNFA